jgi:hypothetical protein
MHLDERAIAARCHCRPIARDCDRAGENGLMQQARLRHLGQDRRGDDAVTRPIAIEQCEKTSRFKRAE